MLVAYAGRWLLGVRGPEVDYAPGTLGLIGGHVDPADAGPDVLRTTARRELWEETGVDLTGTGLDYLESVLFDDGTATQLSVTFVATAPTGVEPSVQAPAELTGVGWWSAAETAAHPGCPAWLPPLLERAARQQRGELS